MSRSAATERELKLSAGPTFRLPDLASLGEDLRLTVAPPERTTTTYVDTEDLRLARAGVSLRHRSGQGWTAKLPGAVSDGVLARPEITFEGEATTVPADACELVLGYTRTASLKTAARLRTVRRRVLIDDAEGQRLLEIDDDEVSVLASGNRIAARFRELELEMTAHTPPDLFDAVRYRLQEAGAGPGDPVSKYAKALGPRAQQAPDVTIDPLPPRPTAADVIRRAIAASVSHLIDHDPVTRLDLDIEGVHQMRVATRRLRSYLRTFAGFLDADWNSALREELGWLGGVLGANRDADVMLERLRTLSEQIPDPDGAAPLLEGIAKERESAHREVLETLVGERYLELLERLVDAARFPLFTEAAGAPARELIAGAQAQYDGLRARVKRSGKRPTDEELHRVRIHAKRCRYAAEALETIGGKQARTLSAAAADLQTVLGDFNDAVVMRAWLQDRAAEAGAPTAFAAGELAGLELARAAVARASWRKPWKRVAAARPPDRWK